MISGPRLSRHHQRWGADQIVLLPSTPSAPMASLITQYRQTWRGGLIGPSVATPIAHPAGRHAICVQIRRDWSAGTKHHETTRSRPHWDWKPKSAAKSSFSALAREGVHLVTLHIQLCKSKWPHECKYDVADQRNSTWMTNKVFVHSNLLQLHVWHK